MSFRAGITRLSRGAGPGFSLVELLLVVALIGLLLGAVVFNFSGLQRGTRLEEGANQLEALLRYARAHASASGHRVRISFEEDVGEGFLVPLGNLVVTFEPDPLAQPDLFQPLLEAAPYLNSILDVISIEEVRSFNDGTTTARDFGDPSGAVADIEAGIPPATDELESFGFAPITFLPDGSSDSAEITIAARDDDGEDTRQMVIRVAGLTGAIRRRTIVMEDPAAAGQFEPDPASRPAPGKELSE